MAAEDEVVLLRLFQRLSVALLRHHRHMAHAAEVNQTDLLALGLLAVRGPMTVNALGGELELSSAAVSGLVDRLEATGHLARTRDPVDRRRVVVHATALAGQVARTALAPFLDELRAALGRCTPDERAGAARVLEGALDALDRSR